MMARALGAPVSRVLTSYGNKKKKGVCSIHCINEKDATPLWSETYKSDDYGSICANSEMKLPQWENTKGMYNNEDNLVKNSEGFKENDKKKGKSLRLRNKVKGNNFGDGDDCFDLNKNRMDDMVKLKTKRGEGNCSKKNEQYSKVDIKEFEAKPVSLETKCRETDFSKLNQQEFHLLQEIKEQTQNKKKFEKFINHIRESNLKETLKLSEDSFKTNMEKVEMKENVKEKLQNLPLLQSEPVKSNSDKDSLKSTDEENDIKRFSEFLSKNKNIDEKRKCLEEVRNYFERKRRTRLTKRRFQDESKVGKGENNNFSVKKDDFPRERPTPKDLSAYPAKEKKCKFVPCNEEVVEKAVSETLQKFMSLYHFQVSPTIIKSMRKNILEAIQSDSLDSNLSRKNGATHQEPLSNPCPQQRKHSDVNFEGKKVDKFATSKDVENFLTDEKKICSENGSAAFFRVPDAVVALETLPSPDFKDSRKNFFKTLMDGNKESDVKLNRENDVLENENFRRLKREFENCLKSVQFHANGTGLKIQSLVLEKEETTASKGIRFVYNFSKKSLELIQLDCDQIKSSARGGSRDGKRSKNGETQTFFKLDTIKRSMKCQTATETEVCDQSLQTETKILVTTFVQTDVDCNNAKEVKEIKSIDISPGLYRMVKSKDVGRFYLYPEKEEDSKSRVFNNTTTDSFESKCKHCDSRSGKNFICGKKFILNERLGRDTRAVQKNRYRGKGMKRKRKKISLESNPSNFLKEESVESKVHTSISCLFFRNGKNEKEKATNGRHLRDDYVSTVDDELQKNCLTEVHSCNNDRFGCFLFWNGKRIGPGCDLKTHVESLLKEKLKEINVSPESRLEMEANNKYLKIGDANQMKKDKNSDKDLCSKSNAAVICFRKDYSSKMKIFRRVALPDTLQDVKKREDKTPSVVNTSGVPILFKKEKCVQEVGTQISLNEIPSSSVSKRKSASKTSTGSKVSGKRWKKSQKSKEGFGLRMEELVNFVKVVRNIKRFRKEAFDDNEFSPESSFGEVGYTSSFSAGNNNLNNWETPVAETKSKIPKILSPEILKPKEKSEDRRQETGENKHWELIDNVLNKVSVKEKQSLWNDMRQLIKGKFGRDIDEEGAKEVCIEIEQDMPASKTGRVNHAVVARGHYVKSEGDVEVEIDLTMDDLEKILRKRHKKMRRKRRRRSIQNLSKAKKPVSSSSARSGFTSK